MNVVMPGQDTHLLGKAEVRRKVEGWHLLRSLLELLPFTLTLFVHDHGIFVFFLKYSRIPPTCLGPHLRPLNMIAVIPLPAHPQRTLLATPNAGGLEVRLRLLLRQRLVFVRLLVLTLLVCLFDHRQFQLPGLMVGLLLFHPPPLEQFLHPTPSGIRFHTW